MKHSKVVSLLLGGLAMLLFTAGAEAKGLIGERYADIYYGIIQNNDSDTDDIDDTITVFGGEVNIPLNDSIDLGVAYNTAEFDGSDGGIDTDLDFNSLSVGLTIHGAKEETTPFLRVNYIDQEVDYDITFLGSGTEDDTGFSIALGMEKDLGNDTTVTPEITYEDVDAFGDDDDEITLSVLLHRWFGERFGVGGELAYYTDEGDIGATLGLYLAF